MAKRGKRKGVRKPGGPPAATGRQARSPGSPVGTKEKGRKGGRRGVLAVVAAVVLAIPGWWAVGEFFAKPWTAKRDREALIRELGIFESAYYPRLIRDYPCGYAIWMRDHQSLVPAIERSPQGMVMSTQGAGPTSVEQGMVTMRLPRIEDTRAGFVWDSSVFQVPLRKQKTRFFGGDALGCEVWVEVLDDDPEHLVTVVGLVPVEREEER